MGLLARPGKLQTIAYALVPEILPAVLSTTLYLFEFNVRASTVLGVVGSRPVEACVSTAKTSLR